MIGFGQPYLDLTSTWIIFSYPPQDNPPLPPPQTTTEMSISSTAFFGGYTYFEIFHTSNTTEYVMVGPPVLTTSYSGPIYLREDGFKWYKYNTATGVDELLCDFDLVVGDSISSFTAFTALTPAPIITNITNEILFGSITRKKFHLDNGLSFVEGVGNLRGLYADYDAVMNFEFYRSLRCYIQNNQNWGLGPDSLCNFIATSVNTNITDKNKELLKVTDILGRETQQTNQPLFYIYDDGTVEKRIVIE